MTIAELLTAIRQPVRRPAVTGRQCPGLLCGSRPIATAMGRWPQKVHGICPAGLIPSPVSEDSPEPVQVDSQTRLDFEPVHFQHR